MEDQALSRRDFLTCSLAATGLCAAGPALADTPIYRGRDYPVKALTNLPVKKKIEYKEGLYWNPTGNLVQCTLCPKYCQLKPGERAWCRIRVNRGGKLYTEIYNAPCVIATNAIEQGPFAHVAPGTRVLAVGTAGCNLRCKYCQNWQFSQAPATATRNYHVTASDMVALAKKNKCKGIMFTFTEAVISIEYSMDVFKAARKAGLMTALVTAAWIDEEPFRDLLKYVDVVRIDLKGFTDKFYDTVTRGTVEPVKDAIVAAHESKAWLEVINLVVHGQNDNPNTFRRMVKWLKKNVGVDTPFHVTRFYPAGSKWCNLPDTPMKTVSKLRGIALQEGMKFAYVGNCPGHEDEYATYCPNPKCKKMLIKRISYISIEENNVKNGKCKFCGCPIPGHWEA